MLDAVFTGLPVVRVGRGYPQGFADPHPHFIPGSNLTSTKARMLLMACLMKFGSLPVAKDPANPTAAEKAATAKAVSALVLCSLTPVSLPSFRDGPKGPARNP
jgi:L-asparaginase